MSSWLRPILVMLASYGALVALLDGLAALLWVALRDRGPRRSVEWLALRLLPAGGAALLTVGVTLPAYWIYEPAREIEPLGVCLCALGGLTAMLMVAAGLRTSTALGAARALSRDARQKAGGGASPAQVTVLDLPLPTVAVVGALRPRIVAARSVIEACGDEEFRGILAHEQAHVRAADNLKRLIQLAAPDPLAHTALGRELEARWRACVEREADERAVGADPARRVALASALLTIARLWESVERPAHPFGVAIDDGEVEERVRGLLAAPVRAPERRSLRALLALILALPVVAAPAYPLVHAWIEAIVAARF